MQSSDAISMTSIKASSSLHKQRSRTATSRFGSASNFGGSTSASVAWEGQSSKAQTPICTRRGRSFVHSSRRQGEELHCSATKAPATICFGKAVRLWKFSQASRASPIFKVYVLFFTVSNRRPSKNSAATPPPPS